MGHGVAMYQHHGLQPQSPQALGTKQESEELVRVPKNIHLLRNHETVRISGTKKLLDIRTCK